MILKVAGEILDYNEDIEIERQAKLFQDVSGVFGDYSYSFEIPKTDRNVEILGVKSINENLPYDKRKDAEIFTATGELLYSGYLMIEGVSDTISASFFSGNNSWFEATRKNVRTYNYKVYEKDANYTNISQSWGLDYGIVFPLVDRGTLYQRDTPTMYENDWQPFIYVKDVINTILSQSGGIKMAGDLVKDPLYNSLVTTNGGLAGVQDRINDQSVYIGKNTAQSFTSTTQTTVTFTDTDIPFGSSERWVNNQYILKEDMATLSVVLNLKISASTIFFIYVRLNGTNVFRKQYVSAKSVQETITINNILANDVIDVQSAKLSGFANYDIQAGSFIKVSPVKFRKVYPAQLLPDLDGNEFIANIFTMFNVFSSYNSNTRTINTRFLENIKNQDAIDISSYIGEIEGNNFTDLVGSYAKSSRFVYTESGDDFVEEYNSVNPIFYGGGELVIDNDFIEDESDFAEMDFTAPFQIPVKWLGFNLPLLEMNEFIVESSVDYSSVSNVSGNARFRYPALSAVVFDIGDFVRITGSTEGSYDGFYRVTFYSSVGSNRFVEFENVTYVANSQGKLEIISIKDILNEDSITIANLPSTPLSDFTDTTSIYYEGNSITNLAVGYFWLPQVVKPINRIRQALTFGSVNDSQYYQKGLLDVYYKTTEAILNDPVMITVEAYLPEKVFRDIDFTRPVRIQHKDFNLLFLVNSISGYKGSHLPCELELIKLS
jgi:hypothetical protein